MRNLPAEVRGIASTNTHVVRQPPLRELLPEEREQLGRRRRSPRRAGPPPRAVARPTWGWGTGMTAASATAGCPISAHSSATELIHSPPDLIRSLRPVLDLDVAARVDRHDVAGAEPAVVGERSRRPPPVVVRGARPTAPRTSSSPIVWPSQGTMPVLVPRADLDERRRAPGCHPERVTARPAAVPRRRA